MSLAVLCQMSNRYGADARYVLAGGGNTSYKQGDTLYVKGSGAALATIEPGQFVRLSRRALAAIWDREYPQDFDGREAAALADLMAAREPGESGRPSVETLLHDILPFTYVCHLHPGVVNAMTCARDGKSAAARLFPEALWVDAIMPGYVLACAMKERLDEAKARGMKPSVTFIENHGVFVAADTVEEIDALYRHIMDTLRAEMKSPPPQEGEADPRAEQIAPGMRMLLAEEGGASYVRYAPRAFLSREEMEKGLILSLSPDHMVYCGAAALFIQGGEACDVAKRLPGAVADFQARHGALPRVVCVGGVGLFASGSTLAACDAAYDLMLNAADICLGAEAFGGAKPMPDELVEVMGGWEVERYRKGRVLGLSKERLAGKIALVTGAAQGFGLGIAKGLAKEGAVVVLADLNLEGALEAARGIEGEHGSGRALALGADVAEEASTQAMLRACVLRYGGVDLFVANAGIVRAGGLQEVTLEQMNLVTQVNYTAFFLGAKYAARVMSLQREACPTYTGDIVQINSKSGLAGSNKNFAYAGAKFGGIGLVQSFALELAQSGIKVNAVCPGNFLDGPLWSDPEKGLFVQYLRAGKVPGAKSVDEVRAFYEGKVPMGRGCRVEDVVRAILYAVEQQYETGQAIPVTGGQQMLK